MKHSVLVEVLRLRDDKTACRVAKASGKFARDFASIMFVRQGIKRLYERQAVLGAWVRGQLVGFCCAPHLIRKPHTSIYYMGVLPEYRQSGAGKALVREALKRSPHGRLELVCEQGNPEGLAFYKALGFKQIEKLTVGTQGRTAYRLRLERRTK